MSLTQKELSPCSLAWPGALREYTMLTAAIYWTALSYIVEPYYV